LFYGLGCLCEAEGEGPWLDMPSPLQRLPQVGI
jgi:hypothetical protein